MTVRGALVDIEALRRETDFVSVVYLQPDPFFFQRSPGPARAGD
jgi:hypothetical protein